jgi:hypothetical protein
MSIENELLTLYDTKNDIKEALRQCNVSMNGETFREYVDKIDEVIPQTQQWGVTLLDWFGVTDENGKFSVPTSTWDFDASEEFAGELCIRKVPAEILRGFLLNKKIKSINLKDLTEVGHYGMYEFAKACTALETIDLSNLETVGDYGLAYIFQGDKSIKFCDISKIKTVGNYAMYGMFSDAGSTELDISFDSLETISGITRPLQNFATNGTFNTISFPKLKVAGLYQFALNSNVNKISFGALEKAELNSTFTNSQVKELDFSSLKNITAASSMCSGCKYLANINFNSLEIVPTNCFASAFTGCTSLSTISFPSLVNVGSNIFGTTDATLAFRNCTALTEIHFRADMETTIKAMYGFNNKFGATNAAIYFDL